MRVVVNGAERDVVDGTTVPQLVEQLGLRLGSVVVELDGTALLPSEAREAVLRDGARVELVRAVAGG